MTKQSGISTQPYRGTKDQYPEDSRLIRWIFNIWQQTSLAFGYEEYMGPFLEPIELYLSKTSEEIVSEQLYSLHDKGERHLAIRPEMTPTMARMVAAKGKQLTKPIRWFSVATCMRFERPQRSRQRQFDQFNLDILGGHPFEEDIEVSLTIVHMLSLLGAGAEDFRIQFNHRGLVNDILTSLEVNSARIPATLRVMDHFKKLSAEAFRGELEQLGLAESSISGIKTFMSGDIEAAGELLGHDHPHIKYLTDLLSHLKQASPEFDAVFEFSPSVMRGFDYYTGLVFEVFDLHPENRRALFGGGRYDNLVASFGVEPIAGVGYGVSEISLMNFLKVHELEPALTREVDIFCFCLVPEAAPLLSSLAMKLRRGGLKVEQAMGAKKMAKLFSQADRKGAKSVLFIGPDEWAAEAFTFKCLDSKTQKTYKNGEIAQVISDWFSSSS